MYCLQWSLPSRVGSGVNHYDVVEVVVTGSSGYLVVS